MRMYFRVKHFDRFVGAFILAAMVMAVGAFVFISKGQKWFAKRNPYTVVFAKVQGLKPGTAVTVAGMEVGRVKSLRLNPEGQVELNLEILDEYRQILRVDSQATIASTLLGGKTVEITMGSRDRPELPPGAVIRSIEPKEIGDFLKEVDVKEPLKKVNEALENIKSITAKLNDPQGDLFTLLQNVRWVTHQWKSGEGNVGAILQDQRIHGEILRTLDSLRRSASNLEEITQNALKVSRDIPRLMAELDRSVQEVPHIVGQVKTAAGTLPQIMGEVQKAAGDAPKITGNVKHLTEDAKVVTENLRKVAPQIPEIVSTGQESLEEAERLILGLQNHWLLRASMPERTGAGASEGISGRESPYDRKGETRR